MEHVRFEHIHLLWALAAIPLLMLLLWTTAWWRKRQLRKLGDPKLVEPLIGNRSTSKVRFKNTFRLLGLAFLVLAMANPQIGKKKQKAERKGIDIVIALDVSKSMLAEDVAPNRLERARQFCFHLIDRLENDRVGLVIFAGHAYLQMPLTIDLNASKLFLRTFNTDMVPTQGTALNEALEQAEKAFEAAERKHKAIILITDGEDHEEGAIDRAKEIAEEGTTIFTVGVGSPKGAPIPQYNGRYRIGYKKNDRGEIVLSKLNEESLNKLAIVGNGTYFNLTGSTDQINALVDALGEIETKALDEVDLDQYVSYYQVPLLIGLLFLLTELLITYRPTRLFKSVTWLEA